MDKTTTDYLKLLESNEYAQVFALLYSKYINAADDFIDGDDKRDKVEQLLDITDLAREVFSCQFYQQNVGVLYQIHVLVSTLYRDSLKWENADEEWKRRVSRQLGLASELMFMTIISLVRGSCVLKENSLAFKENLWKGQMEEFMKKEEERKKPWPPGMGEDFVTHIRGPVSSNDMHTEDRIEFNEPFNAMPLINNDL